MRPWTLSFAAVGIASLLASSGGIPMVQAQQTAATYTATLLPLNSAATGSEWRARIHVTP